MEVNQLPELGLFFGICILRVCVLLFARKAYFLPVLRILVDFLLELIEIRVKSEVFQLVNLLFLLHLLFIFCQCWYLLGKLWILLQNRYFFLWHNLKSILGFFQMCLNFLHFFLEFFGALSFQLNSFSELILSDFVFTELIGECLSTLLQKCKFFGQFFVDLRKFFHWFLRKTQLVVYFLGFQKQMLDWILLFFVLFLEIINGLQVMFFFFGKLLFNGLDCLFIFWL